VHQLMRGVHQLMRGVHQLMRGVHHYERFHRGASQTCHTKSKNFVLAKMKH